MRLVPLASDMADLVGEQAQAVENRSLLLEKFAIPKSWVDREDKLDDANRWSLLRISEGGEHLLKAEGQRAAADANKEKYSKGGLASKVKAQVLPLLASTSAEASDSRSLRARHSRRFLALASSSLPGVSTVFCATLRSRLAINLSDGLIENGGIALDRLFGLPYIPGSALKGCARHAALAEIDAAAEEERARLMGRFVAVFGAADVDWKKKGVLGKRLGQERSGVDQKGGVTFVAAYPVTDQAAIEVDLTNVHTPKYYTDSRKAGDPALLQDESPRPNPFPVVKAGTVFGFVLALNAIGQKATSASQVLEDATRWLEVALTVHGIGAKTSSGYGWFARSPEIEERLRTESQREEAKAEEARRQTEEKELREKQEAERIANLSPEDREKEALDNLDDQAFAEKVLELGTADETHAKAVIEILRSTRKDRWKRWKKSKKPNDGKRVKAVEETVAKLNLPPLP